MNRYLFDTSTCVFFIRGKLDLAAAFQRVGQSNCFISELTVAELRYGAEKSADPIRSHGSLDNFLKEFNILSLFPSIRRYAEEKVRLQRAGTLLHDEFDLFIAATALHNGYILVSNNTKHFSRFQGLQLEDWMSAAFKL